MHRRLPLRRSHANSPAFGGEMSGSGESHSGRRAFGMAGEFRGTLKGFAARWPAFCMEWPQCQCRVSSAPNSLALRRGAGKGEATSCNVPDSLRDSQSIPRHGLRCTSCYCYCPHSNGREAMCGCDAMCARRMVGNFRLEHGVIVPLFTSLSRLAGEELVRPYHDGSSPAVLWSGRRPDPPLFRSENAPAAGRG
jgi:hypothetical protein